MWDFTIINLEEAMDRVLGHKEMYIRWLKKFFIPATLAEIETAFREKNYSVAHAAAHKIKGTAANLAIVSVAAQAGVLDEAIKAEKPFDEMESDYQLLVKRFKEAEEMFLQNDSFIDDYEIIDS